MVADRGGCSLWACRLDGANLRRWRDVGHQVCVVDPQEIPRGDKVNFNDLLASRGPRVVVRRIEAAVALLCCQLQGYRRRRRLQCWSSRPRRAAPAVTHCWPPARLHRPNRAAGRWSAEDGLLCPFAVVEDTSGIDGGSVLEAGLRFGAGAPSATVPLACHASRSRCWASCSSRWCSIRRLRVAAVSYRLPSRVAKYGRPSISKIFRCMDRRWTWSREAGTKAMPQSFAAAICSAEICKLQLANHAGFRVQGPTLNRL